MKDINATVIVDLNKNEEQLLKDLHKDARWGINKAIKEGLTVKEGEDEDWKKFYEIYKETIIEGGTNAESLEELKKNTTAFLICKKDEKIIAGAGMNFIDMYNDRMPRLYFNASLKEYQSFQPNNLLYWKCMLWCKKNGYKEFDLGGYQIKAKGHLEGINKFKEKWGKVVYYHKDYPIIRAIGRKLIRNSGVLWWLNKKLRGRK